MKASWLKTKNTKKCISKVSQVETTPKKKKEGGHRNPN